MHSDYDFGESFVIDECWDLTYGFDVLHDKLVGRTLYPLVSVKVTARGTNDD